MIGILEYVIAADCPGIAPAIAWGKNGRDVLV
jgi:hypothetical protein